MPFLFLSIFRILFLSKKNATSNLKCSPKYAAKRFLSLSFANLHRSKMSNWFRKMVNSITFYRHRQREKREILNRHALSTKARRSLNGFSNGKAGLHLNRFIYCINMLCLIELREIEKGFWMFGQTPANYLGFVLSTRKPFKSSSIFNRRWQSKNKSKNKSKSRPYSSSSDRNWCSSGESIKLEI